MGSKKIMGTKVLVVQLVHLIAAVAVDIEWIVILFQGGTIYSVPGTGPGGFSI